MILSVQTDAAAVLRACADEIMSAREMIVKLDMSYGFTAVDILTRYAFFHKNK